MLHYETVEPRTLTLLKELQSIESIAGLNLVEGTSMQDIAAMKINAILRRGTKKDFWDIRELLAHYSLREIIDFFNKKFPSQRQLISVPQALVYFDDAESSPDPICLKNLTWTKVKMDIKNAVKDYLS